MKKVVIFGNADFARIARVYLREDSPHEVVAFTVQGAYLKEPEFEGLPVVPFEEMENLYPPDQFSMLVAIGFKRINKLRAEIYGLCKAKGYELITYINSRTSHWGETRIGDNCFIFEENVIQPFVTIGNNVILWCGNRICHDSTIGDHCFITSNVAVSGHCKIGAYSFLGVSATLRDGISIGEENVIGAGAIILKDTGFQAVHATRHTPAMGMLSPDLKSFK